MIAKDQSNHPLLNQRQASDYLQNRFGVSISPNTLAVWRCQKRGPVFLKLSGSSRVFYRTEDLDAYIESAIRVKTIDSLA